MRGYKVQAKATQPLLDRGMNFGVRFAFDSGAKGVFFIGFNRFSRLEMAVSRPRELAGRSMHRALLLRRGVAELWLLCGLQQASDRLSLPGFQGDRPRNGCF